jgi:predicted nucleic acid-binding protein
VIFWDTSALVKCYGGLEPGHARARSLLLQEKGHKGSSILWPEAVSAIVRKLGANRRIRESLLRLCEDHLKGFDLMPLDQGQLESAVRLIRKHGLRAADALHVAAALVLSRELGRTRIRFATSDALQARAARAEGLKVFELPP